MLYGTITWYNDEKGYGFICGDDGVDYFLHHSALPNGHDYGLHLTAGDRIAFESTESTEGMRAINAQLVYVE